MDGLYGIFVFHPQKKEIMEKIVFLIKCVILIILALMCAPIVMIDAVIGRDLVLSFCCNNKDLSFLYLLVEKGKGGNDVDEVDEKDYDVAITILSKIVIVFYGTITSIVIISV